MLSVLNIDSKFNIAATTNYSNQSEKYIDHVTFCESPLHYIIRSLTDACMCGCTCAYIYL